MRLYDVHAHLADPRLTATVQRIIADALSAGVTGILANAARRDEWDTICRLSSGGPVFGALGLHPFFVDQWTAGSSRDLTARLRAHPRIRAVGEIGLDFWRGRDDSEKQITVLAEQLQIARELDLPVILHNRRSWSEFFGVLSELRLTSLRGVCHCFNASRDITRKLLDTGLMMSFCGPITYPNARRVREAARYVPMDCLLTETDCPDLPAAPVGRQGMSVPQHVRFVLEAIAAARGQSTQSVAEQVEANFCRLLRLTPGSEDDAKPDKAIGIVPRL